MQLHQPHAADARLLADQAYYRLRELIVTIELAPGSPISEPELMLRLGLVRTPVREAVRMLQRDRLIDVFPRRGMLVSAINAGDLAALTEVRGTLEAEASSLAAGRATSEDRARVVALLEALERAEGGERGLIGLDQRIHRQIWETAHNPFLAATLEEYYMQTLRIWFLALHRLEQLGDSIGEHRDLLSAIRDGRPADAADAARRHVAGFERAVRSVL